MSAAYVPIDTIKGGVDLMPVGPSWGDVDFVPVSGRERDMAFLPMWPCGGGMFKVQISWG